MKTKSVNTIAFFNLLGPIVLNGINFFTVPIFAKLLGTYDYGLFTIYVTWVNFFSILIGLQISGTLGVAKINIPEEKLPAYYSSVLFIPLFIFTLFLLITLSFKHYFSTLLSFSIEVICIMLLHSLGMSYVNFATIKYTYDKAADKTFLLSILVAVLNISISLILLKTNILNKSPHISRIIGYSFPYIFFGILIFLFFIHQSPPAEFLHHWKFCLPLCCPLVFHGLAHIILSQADKLMLQKMKGNEIVGIFGFAITFSQIISIIYNALNTTWVPFFYDDIKNQNYSSITEKTKNYIFLFTILCAGFILLSPEVIKLFVTKDYWESIPLIPLMTLGNYFVFLYSFPVNFEFFHKKTLLIAIGTISASVINILLNYIFIQKFSMAGAVIATVCSYSLLWIFHHLIAKYFVKNYHTSIKTFFPGCIAILLLCLGMEYLMNAVLFRWIFAIILGLLLAIHLYKLKRIF